MRRALIWSLEISTTHLATLGWAHQSNYGKSWGACVSVCACTCASMWALKRAQPPTTTRSIRLSNKTRIMGIRLAGKAMSAHFALTLQCGTKAIFWQCTHANSDSLAPESPMPGEMYWVKSASLNPQTHIQTHAYKQFRSFNPYKCAGAQTHIHYKCIYKHKNVHTEIGSLSPAVGLLALFLHLTVIALAV